MRRVALVVGLCVAATATASAQADWTVQRDPFDKTVVARWKAILAKNPHDVGALTQLVAMYRKQRTVAQLDDEYAKLPESWANVVVRARLAQTAGDKSRALALFERAVALTDTDMRSWIAIGDGKKPAEARLAYERAVELSPPAPLEKAVLKKLAALPGDPTSRDRAYARLIELDPKNGKLWLDRADGLATANLFAQARDAYTAAEPLLKTDPERRLYAIAQRGRAQEMLNDGAAAIADYNRAIAESPKGYYLKAELTARIIAVHTKAKTLPALLADYQRMWPEKSRGHFEWATIAQLHAALGAQDSAIAALQHAVNQAPAELATQRQLIQWLDAAGRRGDALAQLEAAAKAAPRDAPIHFELAQRYWDHDQPKLLATLAALSRTHVQNSSVHHDLAELYTKLRRYDLALREYELFAKLEPDDDNLLQLGEMYFSVGKEEQAVKTWKRLARSKSAKADAALGEVLFEHELFEDALTAYSRAIERDPNDAELWRARGAVYAAADRGTSALSDTDHAVALLGAASRDAGHAARYQLVRILENVYGEWNEDIADRAGDWEMRFTLKEDLVAGYLLAEFYGRQPSDRLAKILEQLHSLVPGDHGVTLELVRAYRVIREYDKALTVVAALRVADPSRKDELDVIAAKIAVDKRERPKELASVDDIADPDDEIRAARPPLTRDAIRSPIRAGLRLGLGRGLRGPAAGYLTVGAMGAFGSGPIAFVTRLDVVQREGDMRSLTALAGSVGVGVRAFTSRNVILLVGAAQRVEHRISDAMTELDHNGLAVDLTFDVVARNWPATLGVRIEQGLYEHARDTSVIFETGIELR